jgi:hypothetical protein
MNAWNRNEGHMHVRGGLFGVWLLVTAIWLGGCIWFGATKWHWFEANQVYEVADPNNEKYRVEVDPDSTDDEILAFVQKSAGSKWLRKQCSKDARGPWCDVVTSLKMPRQYFSWQYLVLSIGGLLLLLMVGYAFYRPLPGFGGSPRT